MPLSHILPSGGPVNGIEPRPAPAADRRRTYRIAIHQQSRLTFALDGPEPEDDAIHGVTLIDISCDGLMAIDDGYLVPGTRVLLEVPLVGWREAEVRWIADNRAGCRFAEPLDLEELRLATANSPRLVDECPALAALIARMPPLERAAAMQETVRSQQKTSSWRVATMVLATLAIFSFLAAKWVLIQLG